MNFTTKYFENEKVLFLIAFLILVLNVIPYLILGEDSHLRIHDNLDSNISTAKVLIESGEYFSNPGKPISRVFNGIPRSSLGSSFDISLLWLKIFGIFYGYVFNKFLMALAGFFGMYFLLKKHVLPDNSHFIINASVSLLFSLLPFWSISLSVAGLPFVLFSFLNLRRHQNKIFNWIILFLFPFYSSLALTGFFLMVIVFFIILHDIIKTKKLNYSLLSGFSVFGILYMVSHIFIFYSLFSNSGYVTHRTEFFDQGVPFKSAISTAFDNFVNGSNHALTFSKLVLIPVGLVFFILIKKIPAYKQFFYILLFLVLSSGFYGFLIWDMIVPIKNKMMTVLPVQLQRFHWLQPMFWHILFAISLSVLVTRFWYGKWAAAVILVFQFGIIIKSHELLTNRNKATFKQYYAVKQFSEIKTFIHAPQDSYRVISLGLSPSVTQYNGFYTLDGYFNDYPLPYKHKFREIIAKELDKDPFLKNYFDYWGCRCYAFSAELPKFFSYGNQGKNNVTIKHLDLNIGKLKEMGCSFIVSANCVDTLGQPGITLLHIFENPESWWKIYLYKIL